MKLIRELSAINEAKDYDFWKSFEKFTHSESVKTDFDKMSDDEINEWAENFEEEVVSPWMMIAAWALGAKNTNEIALLSSEESNFSKGHDFSELNKHWQVVKVIKAGHAAGYYSAHAMELGRLDGVKAVSFDEMGFGAYIVLSKDIKIKESLGESFITRSAEQGFAELKELLHKRPLKLFVIADTPGIGLIRTIKQEIPDAQSFVVQGNFDNVEALAKFFDASKGHTVLIDVMHVNTVSKEVQSLLKAAADGHITYKSALYSIDAHVGNIVIACMKKNIFSEYLRNRFHVFNVLKAKTES